MRNVLIALLLTLVNTGCSTIDYKSGISDWPPLKVTEHFVSEKELRDACAEYAGFGEIVLACTKWDFDKNTIDTWYGESPSRWLLEHERAHQKGYDHPGGTTLRDSWEAWKARHSREQREHRQKQAAEP